MVDWLQNQSEQDLQKLHNDKNLVPHYPNALTTNSTPSPNPSPLERGKAAFTLAEVLITLGIIGVVAAMTMPALIENYKEKETVTRLKKAHSLMSQLFIAAVHEYSTPDNWNLGNSTLQGGTNLYNIMFKDKAQYSKVCIGTSGCVYQNGKNNHPTLNGRTVTTNYDNSGGNIYVNLVLTDGTTLILRTLSDDCSANIGNNHYAHECARIYLDVNGKKGPNIQGRDFFQFTLTKTGVFPLGSTDSYNAHNFQSTCLNYENVNDYNYGCAAWVLYNENLDYLHCKNLSWNGKKKCK